MKMVNPKLLDPYAKEFKVLCDAASAELRATGVVRDRLDETNVVQKSCLRGVDLVSWMMSNNYCETKLHATQIGATMLRAGILVPVEEIDTFIGDSKTLYKIKESQGGKLRKVSSKLFGRSHSVSPQSLMDSSFEETELERNSQSLPRTASLLRHSSTRQSSAPPPPQVTRRGSIEMVRGMVPGFEDRQSRKLLKANTKKNRSQVSRETQLRVLFSAPGCSGELSDGSGPLEVVEDDMTFPEVGFERGRSKIKFSDTVYVREIGADPKEDAKTKPKEYQRYMDPEEEEPAAFPFPGREPSSNSSNLI